MTAKQPVKSLTLTLLQTSLGDLLHSCDDDLPDYTYDLYDSCQWISKLLVASGYIWVSLGHLWYPK